MRIVRRLVHVLILVLMLLVGATAAVVIVSQTSWFKNWLRGYIVREAGQYLNGTVSIDRLGGNLFFGIEMENVGVSIDGSEVVAVKDLGLDYNVFELVSSGVSVDNIRLNKPVIYLRREGDSWSISRLIKKQQQEADRRGPMRPVAIDQIKMTDGAVIVVEGSAGPVATSGTSATPDFELPKRFEHLDAKLAFHYAPVRYTIDITQLSFRGSDPDIALNELSGGVSVRNDTVYVDKVALRTAESSLSIDGAVQQYLTTPVVNMEVSSDKLSLPEMARLVPALAGIRLQPAFEVKLDGPLDHLKVDMNVRSSAGQMTGTVVADVKMPGQSAAGTVSVRRLDLGPILNDPKEKTDITADAKIDLRAPSFSEVDSLRGTVSLNAPRIVAAGFAANQVKGTARIDGRRLTIDGQAAGYGASATAVGSVVLPESKKGAVAFDLHGQARHVDLRRLPPHLNAPFAATDVNAEYHVVRSGSNVGSGFSRIYGDLGFAPSTIAGATVESGSTLRFDVNGRQIGYETDATVADLDLQRVGEEFRVQTLAADRYKSSINGHVVASGRATTPARINTMNVTASGTLHDTSIMGGRIPQMTFAAAIEEDSAHVKASGSFAGFDPAIASGRPAMKGTVGGTLDVDGTVTNLSGGLMPDTVEGTAKINLEPSTVGGLDITRGTIDGDYRRSTADLRTFDIVGRDINVKANGRLALNETDQSNLKVHADSPTLERVGNLVDQPVAGIGQVDLTVTGNKRELLAAGTVIGGGVKYGSTEALSVSSDFTAKVPQLDLASASVSATTHGTFVTIAGQNINDLTATTDYANQRVTFDATAKQPQRTLAAAGSLVMHPDHKEVHLQRLSLATEGLTWQTVPGSEATIQYANNAIKVQNFKLANGDQQMTADGAFGLAGDSLNVTASNVDVGMIDALMLRPPQLSGRLNAVSTITGTKDALKADTQFTIAKGGFRKFQYDSFGGTFSSTGKAITLDTKLQQNPTTWLDVKGRVPTALFGSTGSSSSEPIDLFVDSTPIDAGLVQGFTTSLINVTGTLEAHLHVVGSAADPHPNGTITVQNAAFTLVPNGVVYTDLDGKIDLQPDRIHIDEIRVLDNQSKPLTITGDLAIHEREVGGLSIAVKAADFKVIDNEMGNVRVNSDLRLTGEMKAPRIEGDLGVTTGQINLDPILNLVGASAYPTEQIEYTTADRAAAVTIDRTPVRTAFGIPATSGLIEATQIDVRVTVPNDLVIKANDLRALDSPISLGALNVTLGGNLYVGRTPYDRTRLWGTVNTVRGTYDFQGRRFTILRDGTIRFEGLDEFDPELNIRTERLIQGVTANVVVAGTLKQPQIVLSSNPPLEQADILSLIVFNQPINQLGEGQQLSLAQRAQALATGAVATQLANSIGNALGVDVFEISTAPESGAAAELTIGQQVGPNLFVKLQQGIGDQTQTNFILEYELASWLRLQTNVIQGASTQQQLFQRMQGSGVNLFFFFSY
ncbi:MAG TPA: translocation/assembly module TamB domain-containing protein [Vicinamibacterales bacterium]